MKRFLAKILIMSVLTACATQDPAPVMVQPNPNPSIPIGTKLMLPQLGRFSLG